MNPNALTDAVLDIILAHPDAMACAANDSDLALALLRRSRQASASAIAPITPNPAPITTPPDPQRAERYYRGRLCGRANRAVIDGRERYRSDHYFRTAQRLNIGERREEVLPMGDGSMRRLRVVYLNADELGEVCAEIVRKSEERRS